MSKKTSISAETLTFESLKQEIAGSEFWYVRELQSVLGYSSWDKFKRVIKKAITAGEGSDQSSEDHFSQMGKMVAIGSSAQRSTRDYQLSRYACYLTVQDAGKVSTEIAKNYAKNEFEKYGIVQDALFESNFYMRVKALEKKLMKCDGGGDE